MKAHAYLSTDDKGKIQIHILLLKEDFLHSDNKRTKQTNKELNKTNLNKAKQAQAKKYVNVEVVLK